MDLHGQIMNLPARLPPDCAKMATATAYKAGHRDARHAAAELASAHEEELAALRKDAERYRWLRDVGDETWVPMGKRPGVNFTHEIDRAIDAAIARAKAIGAA